MSVDSTLTNELGGLTERQLEILSLVSKGCSNMDIAQLLEISPNTVKAHLASVLERLNVCNRTEASVLYEKHMHGQAVWQRQEGELCPFINIKLIYKNLSRTREIAENLSGLVQGFEVFTVHTQASNNLIDDSQDIEQPFLIKIDDLSEVNAALQISLFSHDPASNQQALLYKSDHSLEAFEPETLIKHAVQIYRQILQHQVEQLTAADDEIQGYIQLCQALEWVEAINPKQLNGALQQCDQLLLVRPKWHLLYAVKAVVLYKLITNGFTQDVSADMHDLVTVSRKALSLKPESSWSQLAFAYFCALNSDLDLTVKHLQASLQANPCQQRAKQLLGQILAFSGQIPASIEVFKQMLATFPDSEATGSCYGALSLVYYCADDFVLCQQMAERALMYEDAPQVPMILTLLAVAEQSNDKQQIQFWKQKLESAQISDADIQRSLQVAGKVVPAELLQGYLNSLQQVGVI